MAVQRRLGRPLRRLVRATTRFPAATLVVAVVLAGLSVWYALTTLTFQTSNRKLLPRNLAYVERYAEYDREFGELDDVAIVVEAPSFEEARAYASRLVRELKARRVPLKRIAYRVDPRQFEGRALLYLSREKLAQIRDRIFDYQEFMETFAERPTLDRLVEGLATQIATQFVANFLDLGLADRDAGAADFKFVENLIAQLATRLERPARYRSPWGGLFGVEASEESSAGYFLSDDERLLFVLAEPLSEKGSFTGDRDAIEGVRAAVAALRPAFPRVQVGVTGKPALQNDEMVAAFRDSQTATIIAFGLTLVLLVLAFLRVAKPLAMLLILALALCWSVGVATLVVGHLSLFSVIFISIVIGIGIDYGIYFLFRYEEELFLGRSLREALEITAARSGPGMLLGAATAAGTFYVLCLTDFRGLQELGFIAGSAILLNWLAMITVFPAALVVLDRRHASRVGVTLPRAIALERVHVPVVERLAGSPRTVLALAAVLTGLAAWGLPSVRFDYNLLNLQAFGTESVVWEQKVLATAGRSGFSALAVADSLEELRRKHHAFDRLATVSEVDSALLLFPEDEAEKRKIISDFAPLVGPVRIGRPTRADVPRLITALETLKRRFDLAAAEAPPGEAKGKLERVTSDLGRLIVKLRQTDHDLAQATLNHFQSQVYRDFVGNFQRLQANLAPPATRPADFPEELRRKFVSERGRFLLQIHPAVDIWDRALAGRFIDELRAVDPDVTGTPVITHAVILHMERAYRWGTIYAIALITLITFATLHRVKETLLALSPLALGLTWMAGLMYFFDLQFTMGNVFGLPLILGASAEYGLNVVIRFMEGSDHGGPTIARSTAMAVLVNGLTTVVGFGSLMVADHRGIFGLGLLLTLGTATSLVAALVVLPVLLRLTHRRPPLPPPPAAADTPGARPLGVADPAGR